MKTWPVQDAKARFSEFLDACLSDGPQCVSRRGTQAAVLIPMAEWERLSAQAPASLKALLLSPQAATDLAIPRRGAARRRSLPVLR